MHSSSINFNRKNILGGFTFFVYWHINLHGLFNAKAILVGLVTLFNGVSTLFSLFNAKAILLEEQ